MKEYKFRVWDKDTKRMHICGEDIHDEIDFEQGTNKAFYYNLQNGCGSLTENSTYILMQYTGLKDKNGKEIYEGDIVSFNLKTDAEGCPNIIGYIEYQTTFSSFRIMSILGSFALDYNIKEIEVIGNIYDNPELLDNKINK